MAPTELNKAVIPFLVAMMLLTGVCNTLLTKYQVSYPFRLCFPSLSFPPGQCADYPPGYAMRKAL